MKVMIQKIWGYALFMLIFPLLMSCSARINGSLAENGSADLSVSMALEPRITSLVWTFAMMGGQTSANLLDAASITRSMSTAPGISSVSFKNTTVAAIEGPIRIANVSEFLSVGGSASGREGFIHFEQGRASGQTGGKCVISINRENGPAILGFLAADVTDYLSAILAPIATGELMTKTEYLDLISSIYGKLISDEIANSRIRAAIELPGQVTAIKGGTFFGKKAEFVIPLVDILVLETPVHYEVSWR